MIAQSIKKIIEFESTQITKNNPFVLKVKEGRLTREELSYYLYNMKYVLSHTPKHLKLASECARQRGLESLAAFFEEKIIEESGHDGWAGDDLQRTGLNNGSHLGIAPEIKDTMEYNETLIKKDPRLYLSYISFTEYFMVLAAPDFLQDLEKMCGVTRDQVTVISKHEEADKHHIGDDLKAFEAFCGDPEIQDELLEGVRIAAALVNRGLTACAS